MRRGMGRSAALATLVVSVLLASACSDDPEPPQADATPSPSASESPSPTPAASPTSAIACVNALDPELLNGSAMRTQGRLIGDVDGDSVDDVVTVAIDPSGEPGCQTFIVVETDAGNLIARTDPDGFMAGFEPQLQSLVEIDGRPGLEIVAQVLAGASTQFGGMFTVVDGSLQRVEVEPTGVFSDGSDLFPFGGSVGHMEASDCAADGRVVVSVATPTGGGGGDRYEVVRTLLRFEGAELVQDAVDKEVVSAFEIQDLPEYGSSPFGSCPTS